MKKNIKCDECCKIIAKIDEQGNVFLWCKSCKKEIPVYVLPKSQLKTTKKERFQR